MTGIAKDNGFQFPLVRSNREHWHIVIKWAVELAIATQLRNIIFLVFTSVNGESGHAHSRLNATWFRQSNGVTDNLVDLILQVLSVLID